MAGTNLTRAEAAERAQIVATQNYRIELDLTTGEETFAAVTEIDFEATPGADTFLDLIAKSVERVVLNGAELDPASYQDSRLPLPNLAAQNTVRVESTQYYSRTGEGLHRYVDPADGEVYLYSQFEVADARRVFANFEQPDLKANFTFTVTAPENWKVFSVSPTPEPVALGEGKARWDFTPTERLSTYLVAIVAGPYEGVEGEPFHSIDGRDIPLGVYARKSLAPYLDADEIFTITRQGFEYYEANYGHPYPFRKYDQVFCPEYNAGAMEHPGLVTIVETYVFRTKPTGAIIDRRTITILHEQAHMWFGDLVTMKWWDDLWLNESFAEFMSHLAAANNTRWKDAWTTFLASEKTWAIQQDQLPSTHPIAADIRDLEDVLVNFDGITYGKGASVLKQLVAYVGQEQFLAGVRAYIAKHKWGNATLTDLLTELEASSGRDLKEWTRVWLEESGVNTLRPEVEASGGVIDRLTVVQSNDANSSLRPHRIRIAGYDLDGDGLRCVKSEWVDIAGERTEIASFQGAERPDLILLNSQDWGYAKIRFDADSFRVALENLEKFDNHLDRSVVVFAAMDMMRDGELDAHTYADIALAVLADETDGTVLRVVLGSLHSAVELYSNPATRTEFAAAVSERIFELALTAAPGSDRQLQLMGAAMRRAVSEEQLGLIAGWRDGVAVPEGYDVDQEVRWNILIALAANGRADQADIDAEFARDSSSFGQIFAAQAEGALPDSAAKEKVWEEIVHPETNTRQRNLALGTGRSSAESVRAYAEKYFAVAKDMWDNNSVEIASNMLEYAYPAQLAGRTDLGVDLLALGQEWLATTDAAPACRRIVSEVVDGTARAVRNQEADRKAGN
ncbi:MULTISPECIES: aminopeptidase N [Actinotignum]|uniref:aminopeptidase N n=1 Tax=Actinotignum TaxID=1653174 RepID=UPI000B350C1D|nr:MULTISPECIES: aminopeptidase N [Actinotignum]MBS5749046.1 aminopeptidase N [Actinotignum schaalii]MDE1557882.1 aminopeptidase N [Actinotignum schaalii]MDE1662705.1 aminopeptidase N [Actinotignum schaalii]MDK6373270.1 aminopeptidase N [Actinotignum timonense]MDK6418866.1 aminopeptidase N [Actinotignum timonense]